MSFSTYDVFFYLKWTNSGPSWSGNRSINRPFFFLPYPFMNVVEIDKQKFSTGECWLHELNPTASYSCSLSRLVEWLYYNEVFTALFWTEIDEFWSARLFQFVVCMLKIITCHFYDSLESKCYVFLFMTPCEYFLIIQSFDKDIRASAFKYSILTSGKTEFTKSKARCWDRKWLCSHRIDLIKSEMLCFFQLE